MIDDVGRVVLQMQLADMPPLPSDHPKIDGRIYRFGPKKKAWYVLRRTTLKTGREVITGAYGIYIGLDPGTIQVTCDSDAMSAEERADLVAKRREEEERAAEEKRREQQLAANRALDEWNKAERNPVAHAYLDRKKITPEGVRVNDNGELLIPMMRAGQMVGRQRIDPAGNKRYSSGMDKVGAACLLGGLAGQAGDAGVIGLGEGYATCRTVRMASALLGEEFPVAVAFDAGSIGVVAQELRRRHPGAHMLFLVDDDYLLEQRFTEHLAREFDVQVHVPIDGAEHTIQNSGGESVQVTAQWCVDANGVDYIASDVRRGRRIDTRKFENAGLSRSMAAAKLVGNASLAIPSFGDRGGRKLTDWNDLHADKSLEVVASQLAPVLLAAKRPKSVPPSEGGAQAVSALPAAVGTNQSPDISAAPSAAIDNYAGSIGSPAPSFDDAPARADAMPDDAGLLPPPPSTADAAPEGEVGLVSLGWALSHCALIQGTTEVWDSVNKLRMKAKAFVTMVGKESAKQWENSPQRRSISPRNLPATVRGVAATTGGAGDDSLLMMLERYTLLYGTKTVWDHDRRKIIGYDAMALSRGANLAERWLEHSMRREIDLENLVFDPTQTVDLKTHINMFEGFPLKPKKDDEKAGLALELLASLCFSEPNREELFQWVLRWLAYPLQHPGAKMQTALLFFGEKQGTGKSLFFEGIVKPIYGEYGATGGQNQLDSTYTVWRSQKLFVLFEEILSRQDKYSSIGLIKHMITGRTQPISQKFKDDRDEANHMNTVMLSNEFQAVPLEPHDRRFCVADVRTDLDPELLGRIKAVLEDGLIEAFYAFLLEYPLGDFNPHTWPPMTAAKERVISFGRPDWEAFYLAWSGGELDAPYCSCLSNDLYLAYDRYCSRYGLRGQSLTKFAELMGNRLKKDRQWVTIGAKRKLLTVLHVPDQEGDPPDESLSARCERFRRLADIKAEI